MSWRRLPSSPQSPLACHKRHSPRGQPHSQWASPGTDARERRAALGRGTGPHDVDFGRERSPNRPWRRLGASPAAADGARRDRRVLGCPPGRTESRDRRQRPRGGDFGSSRRARPRPIRTASMRTSTTRAEGPSRGCPEDGGAGRSKPPRRSSSTASWRPAPVQRSSARTSASVARGRSSSRSSITTTICSTHPEPDPAPPGTDRLSLGRGTPIQGGSWSTRTGRAACA